MIQMLIRLLEYNVLASRQYDHLPVYSYVICLREEADVADPPATGVDQRVDAHVAHGWR